MAKVTTPERGRIRVDCDCGSFIHEIYRNGEKLLCETYRTRKADAPSSPPAKRKTKSRDDLDILMNGTDKDDDEGSDA